jgi:hypothetical protein
MSLRIQITRSSWCENCCKNKKPQENDFFLAKGKGSSKFIVHQVSKRVHVRDLGMTPHLFTLLKAKDNQVHVTKTCMMVGCGVGVIQNDQKEYQTVILNETGIILSLEDWNCLIMNSDYGYRLD